MKCEISECPKVILEGKKEIEQFYRLLKNECDGAEIAEATVYEMYYKLRILMEQPYCIQNRIDTIKECLESLKRFEGKPKPIDSDIYRLIRNIGKYIVEQSEVTP